MRAPNPAMIKADREKEPTIQAVSVSNSVKPGEPSRTCFEIRGIWLTGGVHLGGRSSPKNSPLVRPANALRTQPTRSPSRTAQIERPLRSLTLSIKKRAGARQISVTADAFRFAGPLHLPQVFDDRILLASNPSDHGGHEDLPGVEHRCHPTIVARSVLDRKLSAVARKR